MDKDTVLGHMELALKQPADLLNIICLIMPCEGIQIHDG